jgi:16S rRNA processing protein RimM
MIRENEVYKIGVIGKAHGVNGEVNFLFSDAVWDDVEADYLVLKIEGIPVPFFLEEYRFRSDSTAIVKFEDVETEAAARELTGVEVYFPYALRPQGDEAEYTWGYFVGFRIQLADGPTVGTVTAVDESTVNTLFEVESADGREHLIPAQEAFITEIDHEERIIHMQLPQGLLSMDESDDE